MSASNLRAAANWIEGDEYFAMHVGWIFVAPTCVPPIWMGTTLIIANRLSTVRLADRIIILDGASIVEEGIHRELLARNGRYAHLYRLQASPREGVSLLSRGAS